MKNGESPASGAGLGKVLRVQLVAASVVVVVVSLVSMLGEAGIVRSGAFSGGALTGNLVSSLYGCGLALTGTILASRSVSKAGKVVGKTGHLAMIPIYSGLLNKLVIVGGGIGFGLVFLKLGPIFVVTGFLVVQLATAWLVARPEDFPDKDPDS